MAHQFSYAALPTDQTVRVHSLQRGEVDISLENSWGGISDLRKALTTFSGTLGAGQVVLDVNNQPANLTLARIEAATGMLDAAQGVMDSFFKNPTHPISPTGEIVTPEHVAGYHDNPNWHGGKLYRVVNEHPWSYADSTDNPTFYQLMPGVGFIMVGNSPALLNMHGTPHGSMQIATVALCSNTKLTNLNRLTVADVDANITAYLARALSFAVVRRLGKEIANGHLTDQSLCCTTPIDVRNAVEYEFMARAAQNLIVAELCHHQHDGHYSPAAQDSTWSI